MSPARRWWSLLGLLVLCAAYLVAAPAPAQAALSVQLLTTGEYDNGEGYVVFVGEVVNDGTVTAERVHIAISLRNADGTQIESAATFTTPFWVKPGERAPFRTQVWRPAGYDHATFRLAFFREATHRANHNFTVTVTDDVVHATGVRRVSGTVRNDNPHTAEYLQVIGTFYGPDERVSDSTYDFPEGQYGSVRAGETATWELTTRRPSDGFRVMAESSDETAWVPPSPGPSPTAAPSPPPQPGARFAPLTPSRLLDSREGLGAPSGRVASGATVELDVLGRGGVPPSGVTAVALNVTSVGAGASGFVTAYPSGQARPLASSLNYTRGQTIANLVVTGVGGDGRVALYSFGGSTHLLADVVGWYSDSEPAAASRHDAVPPTRLLDTRGEGIGTRPGRVPSGGTVDVRIRAQPGIALDGVTAVALNVTATGGTAAGFVTAYPTGEQRPHASSLNYGRGQTIANLVIAKLSADGYVSLYNYGGATHLIADVVGWYAPADPEAEDRYNAVTPARLLDTRDAGTPVASDATLALDVLGRGGVPADRVSAVVLNVTATRGTGGGFVTVHPDNGQYKPLASSLNYSRGQTVANLVVVEVAPSGQVLLYNYGGSTHLVADVVGWFTTG